MKLEKKMIVGSTLNTMKWSRNSSPKTKIDPRSARSRNAFTASPKPSNSRLPGSVRRINSAKTSCSAVPKRPPAS